MFAGELRHETERKVRIGVLLAHPRRYEEPIDPIWDAELNWFYWRYIVKADGTVIDIVNHEWSMIPNCAGVYFLTLTAEDTNQLGQLTLYIHDAVSLGRPILMHFDVVDKNVYDAKYGFERLKVETEPQGE